MGRLSFVDPGDITFESLTPLFVTGQARPGDISNCRVNGKSLLGTVRYVDEDFISFNGDDVDFSVMGEDMGRLILYRVVDDKLCVLAGEDIMRLYENYGRVSLLPPSS